MKIYVYKRIEGIRDALLLQLLEAKEEKVGGLFQSIETEPFRHMVTFVETPEDASCILLPHNYFSVADALDYLKELELFAEKYNKKILILAYGDSSEPIRVTHGIILRTSQYKTALQKNEIIVPPFVEDLGEQYGVYLLEKTDRNPVVGFAGWSGFKSNLRYIKYLIKLLYTFGPRRQGIYFRRKIIAHLKKSPHIATNFALRNSFSAHKNDIEDRPEKIRQEYVDILKKSDFALSVRGDGNYSLRFFEILSLGRIPLYVDTDTVLPLEHSIPYDSCMVRINYKNIPSAGEMVREKWVNMNNDEYVRMQQKCREIFTDWLIPAKFYAYLFRHFDAIVDQHERAVW